MALKFEYRLKGETLSREGFKSFCRHHNLTHKVGFAIFRFQREIRKKLNLVEDGFYLDGSLYNLIGLAKGRLTPKKFMKHLRWEDFLIHNFSNFEFAQLINTLRKHRKKRVRILG